MERLHSEVTLSVSHIKKKSLSTCFCYTLLECRRFHSLIQIYKVLHRISPPYLFHLFHYAKDITTRQGRNPYHLFVPSVRTNYGKSSLRFRGTSMWNSLHLSLYNSESVAQFKRNFHCLNIDHYS